MFKRPPEEPPLTFADVNSIMEALMTIDAKLDDVLRILREEDDGEPEMDT
jgi:hypothetical protein